MCGQTGGQVAAAAHHGEVTGMVTTGMVTVVGLEVTVVATTMAAVAAEVAALAIRRNWAFQHRR